MKYWHPPLEIELMGLHTSLCTRPNKSLALTLTLSNHQNILMLTISMPLSLRFICYRFFKDKFLKDRFLMDIQFPLLKRTILRFLYQYRKLIPLSLSFSRTDRSDIVGVLFVSIIYKLHVEYFEFQ